jgi:hypothetical protein
MLLERTKELLLRAMVELKRSVGKRKSKSMREVVEAAGSKALVMLRWDRYSSKHKLVIINNIAVVFCKIKK